MGMKGDLKREEKENKEEKELGERDIIGRDAGEVHPRACSRRTERNGKHERRKGQRRRKEKKILVSRLYAAPNVFDI